MQIESSGSTIESSGGGGLSTTQAMMDAVELKLWEVPFGHDLAQNEKGNWEIEDSQFSYMECRL